MTGRSSGLRVLALAALLAALPTPAAAEWHLIPFAGFTFKGGTSIVDTEVGGTEGPAANRHWFVGGAVTLIGERPIGVESIFLFVPGFFESSTSTDIVSSRTLAWMGNVVLATPRRWNEYGLRPFVSGGLGVMNAEIDYVLEFPLPVHETVPAFNLGGGAVGFLSDRVGVRFDLRYFGTLRRNEALSDEPIAFGQVRMHYWTAAIGVVFRR